MRWQQGSHKKGGDLLSRVSSTIGAEELNFSVRNGKRWILLAITTLIFCIPFRDTFSFSFLDFYLVFYFFDKGGKDTRFLFRFRFFKKGSFRVISTTRLHTLLHFHL